LGGQDPKTEDLFLVAQTISFLGLQRHPVNSIHML